MVEERGRSSPRPRPSFSSSTPACPRTLSRDADWCSCAAEPASPAPALLDRSELGLYTRCVRTPAMASRPSTSLLPPRPRRCSRSRTPPSIAATTRVFDRLSLEIPAGRSTVILGPNGAGKTTLLQLVTRDLYPVWAPDAHVRLFGEERWNLFELRRRLGIVSHELLLRHQRELVALDVVLSGFHSSIGLWGRAPADAATPRARASDARADGHRPPRRSRLHRDVGRRAAPLPARPRAGQRSAHPAPRRADGEPRPARRVRADRGPARAAARGTHPGPGHASPRRDPARDRLGGPARAAGA